MRSAAFTRIGKDELRFLVAAKLYALGRITSGRAAQIAGIERVDFLERLGSYRISGLNCGAEELEESEMLYEINSHRNSAKSCF
jgi:predicted HTH domain antitoxin